MNETENINYDEHNELDIVQKGKKDVLISDTITLQIIMVLIVAIIFIGINTFFPNLSNSIYNTYIFQMSESATDCYNNIKADIIDIFEEVT